MKYIEIGNSKMQNIEIIKIVISLIALFISIISLFNSYKTLPKIIIYTLDDKLFIENKRNNLFIIKNIVLIYKNEKIFYELQENKFLINKFDNYEVVIDTERYGKLLKCIINKNINIKKIKFYK